MTKECRDRDITITPHQGRVRVLFAGAVIADTDQALDLREATHPVVHYVPRVAVDAEILLSSDHHTVCPFKGEAAYHHLRSGDEIAENAVWYYPDPCPLVAQIGDHVAFWGDQVRVEAS
jgi:uncharacterized protein (DUF427 family)